MFETFNCSHTPLELSILPKKVGKIESFNGELRISVPGIQKTRKVSELMIDNKKQEV